MDIDEKLQQVRSLFEQKHYEEGLNLLLSLPQEEPEVQLLFADYYDLFLQHPSAFRLYEQAAQKGNPQAMYMVAKYIFYKLDGADNDIKKAQKLLLQAAQSGNLQAMANLADYYARGEYQFPKNEELSLQWLTKAAEQGNANGMCELGRCYLFGHGVEIDYAKALYWLNAAKTAGDAHAAKWIKYAERQAKK